MDRTNRLWISVVLFFGVACAVELLFGILLPVEERVLWVTAVRAILTVPVLWYFYRKDTEIYGEKVLNRKVTLILFLSGMGLSVAFRYLFLLIGISGYEEVVQSLMPGTIWLEVFALMFAAPLLEELFFRGILYERLKEIVSVKGAMILSAAFFGLYHGNLSQAIYGFGMGIYLAWAMERYKTITAPIMIHMAANAAAIFLELVILL